MKNFRIFLVLIVFVLSASSLNAQNYLVSAGLYYKNGVKGDIARIYTDGGRTMRPLSSQPSKVTGQPFVSDVWQKGKVVFNNNGTLDVEKLNFDALENMLIMFKDGVEYEYTDAITSFYLYGDGSTMKFLNVMGSFYEVLNEEGITFLKKHKKSVLVERKYSEAWGEGKIVDDDEYYVIDNNKGLLKISKGNGVLRLFGDKQSAIKEFSKSESLNLNKEDDLKKLFKYHSTL